MHSGLWIWKRHHFGSKNHRKNLGMNPKFSKNFSSDMMPFSYWQCWMHSMLPLFCTIFGFWNYKIRGPNCRNNGQPSDFFPLPRVIGRNSIHTDSCSLLNFPRNTLFACNPPSHCSAKVFWFSWPKDEDKIIFI